MAYVTKYKIMSVLQRIDGKDVNQPINKYLTDKYFFLSDRDINTLTVYYTFLKNPREFIENNHVKWTDSKTFMYEGNPCFHKSSNCKALQSKFDNFYIPQKLKEQKLTEVLRNWAERNRIIFDNDREMFIEECIKFFLSTYQINLIKDDFKRINKSNSGVENYENYSLEDLKSSIEKKLIESKRYFEDLQKKKVLTYFRNKMFLSASTVPIKYNPTEFDDKVVKKIMSEIDEQFIKPVNKMIIEICIKDLLDKQEFSTTILEVLNFRNCNSCYSDYNKDEITKVSFVKN